MPDFKMRVLAPAVTPAKAGAHLLSDRRNEPVGWGTVREMGPRFPEGDDQ